MLIFAGKIHLDGRDGITPAHAGTELPCGSDSSCDTVFAPPLVGDANCDGAVNDLDVPVLIGNLFDCNACPSCPLENSDTNLDGRISVADLLALMSLIEMAPTPTPTPTPGPDDCCQCDGTICDVPEQGLCPEDCTVVYDAACIDDEGCIPNTPTPTPTPTLGADDCCQCAESVCAVPSSGACPTDCEEVRDSACLESGLCTANTPTSTPTPTLGANDCCQCEGVLCAVPTDGTCPTGCNAVVDSACLQDLGCVLNTVTPTPTPTLGENDCCQCADETCAVPFDGACPVGCEPQRDSACLESGLCTANTPTQTLTPTPTLTPTLGLNDCCQCEGQVCGVPMGGVCPEGCVEQRDSACLESGLCTANTPTPTLTPTPGPNDCCQCADNVCTVPDGGMCPPGCEPQFDSACEPSGLCVQNTPTPTITRPPVGTATRTRTMTPLVIPFPC